MKINRTCKEADKYWLKYKLGVGLIWCFQKYQYAFLHCNLEEIFCVAVSESLPSPLLYCGVFTFSRARSKEWLYVDIFILLLKMSGHDVYILLDRCSTIFTSLTVSCTSRFHIWSHVYQYFSQRQLAIFLQISCFSLQVFFSWGPWYDLPTAREKAASVRLYPNLIHKSELRQLGFSKVVLKWKDLFP